MGVEIGIAEALQMISISVMMIPVTYWIIMSYIPEKGVLDGGHMKPRSVTILLPMRNEGKNVVRKLESIVSEVLNKDFTKILVVNSGSDDDTAKVASEFLSNSFQEMDRWEVVSWEEPGKSRAINKAIENLDSEIIVMSDADADVCPGWLEIIIQRLSEGEVGVVSGLEDESFSKYDKFNNFYRSKSNSLRIKESEIDSTPVLEGSIIAWDAEKIGKIRIDENVNADDAQIGLIAIRKGLRSIVDSRITFHDFEKKRRTFGESIRRSQGLSIVLLKNMQLSFFSKRPRSRIAIVNAISLYVIFPWMALIFSINSAFSFYLNPEISLNWPLISILSVIFVSILPSGRSLCTGVAISLISHTQAIIGIRHNIWNPIR